MTDLPAIRARARRGYTALTEAAADVLALLPMVLALDLRLTAMQAERVGPKRKRKLVAVRPCACGCGESLEVVDGEGRPRRFVKGHNLRVEPGSVAGMRAAMEAAARASGRRAA